MPTTAVHGNSVRESVRESVHESVRKSVRTRLAAALILRTFRPSRTQLILLKGRRQQYVVRTAHMQHIAHLN